MLSSSSLQPLPGGEGGNKWRGGGMGEGGDGWGGGGTVASA